MEDVPSNAPEECPGTGSEKAGFSSACANCPNQSLCSSPTPPDLDIPKIKERLAKVKHIIVVVSGKGGVGKSTFATQLALGLAAKNEDDMIGLLDVDICGPSIPTILGLEREQIHTSNTGWSPVFYDDNFAVISVGFLLDTADDAVIWRGPKKNGLIKQFLKDVDWNDIDYLIVDTPPGTSDEHLSLVKYLKLTVPNALEGAVVVTTPQEVSLLDVRKEITFCKKTGLNILGIVENMSSFVCPNCKNTSTIFKPTTGGAKELASSTNIPFLGSIPLDPLLTKCCDNGLNFMEQFPASPTKKSIDNIIQGIEEKIEQRKM